MMNDIYHLRECEYVNGYRCPECGRQLYASHAGRALRCASAECYAVLVTEDSELWRRYGAPESETSK